ncbi:DUF6868 family protein [Rhodovibrionaceae bacterium A322]
MTLDQLTAFFGWCSVINSVVLLIAFLWSTLFRSVGIRLHAALTGVDEAELPLIYFKFLAYYKLGTLLFSITPYLALRFMA